MICRDVIEFLMEYLSGELPSDQRRTFDEHLAACPQCVAYMKSYQESLKLGKAVLRHPDDHLANELPEELVQGILAARKKQA